MRGQRLYDREIPRGVTTFARTRPSERQQSAIRRENRAHMHVRVRARERAMAEINAVRTVRLIGRQVERAISKGARGGSTRHVPGLHACVSTRRAPRALGYFRGT